MVLGVMLSTRGYEYSFEMRKGQIIDPLVVRDSKGENKTFDFSLLCEGSETIYFPGTSEVMKHQSTLTILRKGEKVKSQLVDFSHPLVYDGIDIYQDRFSRIIKYAKIKVVSEDGEIHVHEAKSGGRFKLGDSKIIITVWKIKSSTNSVQLKSNLSSARRLVSSTPVSFSDRRLRGYKFSLVEIFKKESTSLKIIRDPGEGVIWFSFLTMVLGFSITFFFFHQKIWAKVEEKEGGCTITLAGSANKNLRAIEEIINNIQSELSEGKL
jgi:cytochrome c biogenesis protein ResB